MVVWVSLGQDDMYLSVAYTYDKLGNLLTSTALDAVYFGDERSSCVSYDAEGYFPHASVNAAGRDPTRGDFRPKTTGANARDFSLIRDAAREAGVDAREFGDFVEETKRADGRLEFSFTCVGEDEDDEAPASN